MKNIYHSKWFPRLFYVKPDGGNDSGVTGYFLIEWKVLFSIGILHFKKGSREAYHSHAFNAITWWLKGSVTEERFVSYFVRQVKLETEQKDFKASLKPKITLRNNMHRVVAHEGTYALTFRGAWVDYWKEFKDGKFITLTHGRKVV